MFHMKKSGKHRAGFLRLLTSGALSLAILSMLCLRTMAYGGTEDAAIAAPEGNSAVPEVILYVAGTREDYPIEYYDTKNAAYQGIMPDILEAITSRTGITFQYLDKSLSREELLKGRQVDLVTDFKYSEKEIKEYNLLLSECCFIFPRSSGEERIYLAFTDILEEGTRTRIIDALEEVKEEELESILLKNLSLESWEYYHHYVELAFRILCLTITVLAFIFAVLVKKYRRQYQRTLYEDVRTGHTNSRRLEKDYMELVTDEIRCQYCVINVYASNFPDIKEVYGFKEANLLLLLISDVIKENTGAGEMFTRISGDNYILIWKYSSSRQIKMRIGKLLGYISQKVSDNEKEYQLMLHAGIYFLAYHDTDLNEPVYKAVLARRSAVKLKNKVYSYEEADHLLQARDEIAAAELERAFKEGEFILWYQPQISLFMPDAAKIVGYEVLARWQHPKRGLLFPNEFLPVLEYGGMLFRFDIALFEQVCSFMQERKQEGRRILPVSFNFSKDSFEHSGLLESLLQITGKYDISPQYIGIEITELIAHADQLNVTQLVYELHGQGFRLILDRFGSGNTSLIDLERYHVDYVKLAPEFMVDIENPKIYNILAGIISLCHAVDVRVIGNGVEEERQEELLIHAGCDILQGYRYFYPMPYDELKKLEYLEE